MALAIQNLDTGEIEMKNDIINPYDLETGEKYYHWNSNKNNFIKTKFFIPNDLITNNIKKTNKKRCLVNSKESYTLINKKRIINFKEEIIFGYNKTSYILFLIPSLFFYFELTAFIMVILEIIAHIYAHKKNKQVKDSSVYYRTPLHDVTSQFCAICRSEAEMSKVSKLHNERLIKRNNDFKIKFTL